MRKKFYMTPQKLLSEMGKRDKYSLKCSVAEGRREIETDRRNSAVRWLNEAEVLDQHFSSSSVSSRQALGV